MIVIITVMVIAKNMAIESCNSNGNRSGRPAGSSGLEYELRSIFQMSLVLLGPDSGS